MPVDLVTVRITTLLGAEHVFPDMRRSDLVPLMRDLTNYNELSLVNVSMAVLVMPLRHVKTIHANEEVLWTR